MNGWRLDYTPTYLPTKEYRNHRRQLCRFPRRPIKYAPGLPEKSCCNRAGGRIASRRSSTWEILRTARNARYVWDNCILSMTKAGDFETGTRWLSFPPLFTIFAADPARTSRVRGSCRRLSFELSAFLLGTSCRGIGFCGCFFCLCQKMFFCSIRIRGSFGFFFSFT